MGTSDLGREHFQTRVLGTSRCFEGISELVQAMEELLRELEEEADMHRESCCRGMSPEPC